MTLADFLREHLGLTGTHLGCEHGVCGACTVIVDGVAVRSCLMLAVQARGPRGAHRRGPRPTADDLHPLQQAFRETPRLPVRVLHAGLRDGHRWRCCADNPSPDEAEVREALSGNICRCTGYQSIVEGVLLAAAARPRRLRVAARV